MNLLKLLTSIIDYVNHFIKNVLNLRRKSEYLYWIKIWCLSALKNYGRRAFKLIKKNVKINNQLITLSRLIKENNNKLLSSPDEKLIAWYFHYKFQGLDSSSQSLSKDFRKDSNVLRNFGNPKQ